MKHLSRDEMKKVMGGDESIDPEGGITCKTACYKPGVSSGTCSEGIVTIGNTTAKTCDCSISGGSSCY